ncbi:Crp/Fnr family transcriptional regulator [Sulfidibacter corallicola]|uniref:Crp/Fnr family transcriptional regulator n=1 Tax=Sulfidibacter corallicola TaxID=2818388 RepID=A0A8A4TR52_SULCO|nr:Crp/Fnr family transcriptional regulator [Sulfidibacter corallicola]QTD52456.1 Crp/Fnr family transcriptional regulator [Sulfidibacter corallicola]
MTADETFSLFAGLNDEARAELARLATIVSLDRGALFFRQGGAADRCFYLLHGQVKLAQITADGKQVIPRLVQPRQMFGGVAAWSGTTYPVTAEAILPSRAYAWPGPLLFDFMQAHPTVLVAALRFVSQRLLDVQDRLCDWTLGSIDRRLAKRLLDLSATAASGLTREVQGLSRQDMAEMIGTTLYSVSRILQGWKADGLVEVGRRRVRILDRNALATIAGTSKDP